MNIEDLIRAANPVTASDVAAGDSPDARRMLAAIQAQHADPIAGGGGRRARPYRRRTLSAVGLAAIAAGATATVLVMSAVPRAAPRRPAAAAPGGHAATLHPPKTATRHPPKAELMSASQVLLTAAAHVPSGPASGAYWRLQVISGTNWPGGTRGHPYDITLSTSYDQWNPKSPGQREYEITRQLAARPATPADVAAWRAAGSPTAWRSGQFSQHGNDLTLGAPWGFNLDASTVAPAPTATWTVSNGITGYIEGDEPGLTAAQLAQLPTRPRALAALLRHYAKQTYCAQHPSSGCSSVDQIVWLEALYLLEDPVSVQVRSATFQVMASLPGVRLLGLMTDPLGRIGYGLAAGPQDPGGPYYKPVAAAVIDPASGSLLATEEIAPIPRSVQCWIQLNVVGQMRCIGESYLGRSYPGQVGEFVALVSAAWTDASPSLPSATREDPTGFPGLPPAGP